MPLCSRDMSLGEAPSRQLAHSVYHTPTPGTMPELVHGRTTIQEKHGTPVSSYSWAWLGASFLTVDWLSRCLEVECLHVGKCGVLALSTRQPASYVANQLPDAAQVWRTLRNRDACSPVVRRLGVSPMSVQALPSDM